MSNGRRQRRGIARRTPPEHILNAARRAACPDCDSDVSLHLDGHGMWRTTISHDDGCPQLTWRQRHGATSGLMVVAEPGSSVSAEAVSEVVDALLRERLGIRVSTETALSWQERQDIDRLLGNLQRPEEPGRP